MLSILVLRPPLPLLRLGPFLALPESGEAESEEPWFVGVKEVTGTFSDTSNRPESMTQ